MEMSFNRRLNEVRSNVNLYCAQCETQLGIFDNEWIRLTTSYARAKEKGSHFSTEIGQRTQVVPSGPAQRIAEGCVMAEVFCRKCSNMVGQYCKSAPDLEKQPLVDQYFYKLSRTFLKDSRSKLRVNPQFGYGSDIASSSSSRSSMMPRSGRTPTSRWANTPLRQSSRTPASSLPDEPRTLMRRESQDTVPLTDMTDNKWEEMVGELQTVREDITSQNNSLQEHSQTIAFQAVQLNDQNALIRDQQTSIDDHESCLSAQATRIVEQDELIQGQNNRLEEQQVHLSKITTQLTKLQRTIDDLRIALAEAKQSSLTQRVLQAENISSSDAEMIAAAITNAQSSTTELETLRAENQAMKTRLNTIASAVGVSTDTPMSGDASSRSTPSVPSEVPQTLGKRKRNETGRLPSLELGNASASQKSAVASFQASTEQMPTPQSSEDGRNSPEHARSTLSDQTKDNQRAGTQTISAEQMQGAARQDKDLETLVPDFTIDDDNHTTNDQEPSRETDTRDSTSSQGPVAMSEDLRPRPAPRRARVSSSAVSIRKRGRPPGARNHTEVPNPEEDSSPSQLSNNEARRITRSSTRAIQPINYFVEEGDNQIVDLQSETSSPEPSPMQIDEGQISSSDRRGFIESYLPNVQMASSVLGMNLEALIASSQALTRSIGPQGRPSDPVSISSQMEESTPDVSQNPSAQLRNDVDSMEFLQDPGTYDVVDTSDDDDDDLMGPNTTLFGQDDVDEGMATSLEGENTSTLDSSGYSHNDMRHSRSTAPEPMKRKRPAVSKKPITLDRAHIATPQMFAEAYAAGRVPTLAKPIFVPTRERALNNELMQLGLSDWIGRGKRCKEYREAVTVARARLRNSNKAAYLTSRGLNIDLSEPSSMLPEELTTRLSVEARDMPLSDLDNPPVSAPPVVIEKSLPIHDAENEGQLAEEAPRATRARTRRSSVSLLSGLDSAKSQAANTQENTRSQKCRSVGVRKSQRHSVATLAEENGHAADTVSINNEISASNDQMVNDVAIEVADENDPTFETNPKKRKSTGKARGRPRKSAVLDAPITHNESVLQKTLNENESDDLSNSVPRQKATIDVPRDVVKESVGGSIHGVTNSRSQAQRREEAILLRDRMAKELMECEDFDM